MAAGSSPAEELRYAGRKAKTISLPGGFAGLVDPTDGSLYTADPWGLGESFALAAVFDTGSSGNMLSQTEAGPEMLDVPTTGETYDDIGIGGVETFDVSVPTRLLLAPVSIGADQSETLSHYSAYGEYKFQIRQSDPVISLIPVVIDIVGTPVLNQHVMRVVPNSIPFTTPWTPLIDYMDTTLLPSMPADLPSAGVLRVPLDYRNFVEPGAAVDVADNPMLPNVRVVDSRRAPDDQSDPTDWLFDTGGGLTIVGEDLAADIGIDVDTETPASSATVLGVGGEQRTFFGYRVDELIIPMVNDDQLIFEEIVVFVPEAGSMPADLPGIFGMNLIGQSFSLQDVLGYPADIVESPFSEWYVDPFNGQLVLVDPARVPEPSTLTLLVAGGLALLFCRRRRIAA